MSPIDRVPRSDLARETAYVRGASCFWSRLWRSACAAFRCAAKLARAGAR